MKILVFADLQADEGSDRRRQDPGTPLQRWRVQQFYRWASNLVQSRGIDAVWDLGDTTNNRTALSHPTVQSVTRGCAELTSGLLPLYNFKLLGNHEQHLKAQTTHVGNLFTPYFHVIEDRAVISIPHAQLTVVCVSYSNDHAELSSWIGATLETLRSRSNHAIVVLGHFTVSGAQFASGSALQGVQPSSLERADLVLLGHIHRRQPICNGWYVGSPFQQDFGEAYDPAKCVAILDTYSLEVEFVPTPFPVHRTVTVGELGAATVGDDVVRVMVKSSAEAQQLYASPAAGTVEPVYAFDGGAEQAGNTDIKEGLDYTTLTRAYAATNLLPGVSQEDILAAADELKQ